MRSLIIDDELSARSRLKRLLDVHPDVTVVGEAEDGAQGLEQIAEHGPDVVFLDIEMPNLSGFEMLRALPADRRHPLIVFVTSYDEYALAAFEANALAYLLKPVEDQRLSIVLDRARLLIQNAERAAEEQHRVAQVVRNAPSRMDHLVGRRQGRIVLLRPAEILYFAVELGVTKAHTANDMFHVEMTLNDLEHALAPRKFFRAHRSTLVNLAHVREIEPSLRSSYTLIMADAARSVIQVSERQAKVLREMMPGL